MRWVRTWLPLAIVVGGIAAIAATGGSEAGWEGGLLIVSAGLSVWLLNFFFRVGARSDADRDREDRAREFFAEHGYWPDEEPPEGPPPPERRDPHVPPRDPHRDRHRPPRERPLRRPHRRGP